MNEPIWISLVGKEIVSFADPLIYVTYTILLVLVYYFGVLISQALPSRSKRFDKYLQGALFVGFFVLLPLAVFTSVYEYLSSYEVPLPVTLLLLMFFIWVYWRIVYGWKGVIKRIGLIEVFEERLKERIPPVLEALRFVEKFSVPTKIEYWAERSTEIIEVLASVLSSFGAIFVVSLLTVILIGLTKVDTIVEVVILGLLTFLLYSVLAIAYGLGQAYYPPVLIVLNSGQTIEGILYKQKEDSVVVVDPANREFVEIPYSQIVEIRQSVLKHRKPKPKIE